MVYDLTIKSFRKVEPTDYIMNTCGYDINLCPNPAIRREIKELYKSIYNTEELSMYILQTTALAFFNNDREEVFIYTGSGGNGKGLLTGMISQALGSYFSVLPNTFLQTKYKSEQANGSLANCKGKRYVSLSEPDGDASFNIAFVKSLSGNDKITTRHIFGHPMTFMPQFTLFILCNILPKIDEIDGGIVRRLRVAEHPNKFSETSENCQLKKRVQKQEFINEFMLYIFDIINGMDTTKKITPPKIVADATAEYLEENNPFKLWFNSNFTITGDQANKSERVKSSELLLEFNATTTTHKINAKKLKKKMEELGVKQDKIGCMYYLGIKRVIEEEEVSTKSESSESRRCMITD